MTTQDLNIPDPPDDADPQMAAGFVPGAAAASLPPAGHAATAVAGPNPGPAGLMPLPSSSSGQWAVGSGQWAAVSIPTSSEVGPELTLVIQGTDPETGR